MKKKHIIGIDLGGTNLKIALLDSSCRIIHKHALSTGKFSKKEDLIGAVVNSAGRILKQYHLKKSDIAGIGLGLPGPIDYDRGVVHFFPNIPGWKEVALCRILKTKLGVPVYIDNDANVMALAEFALGAAIGSTNAICLTLGTGVGGGLILNKHLYRGSDYAAGEIGHMPINEKGPGCNCGGIACLESYIGNRRIMAQAKKIFKKDIPLEDLSAMAYSGDKKAVALWKNVGVHLGVALTSIVNLLNPDRIVIGGGVANAGRILLDAAAKTIRCRAMSVQAEGVKIVKAELGNDAGMIGAGLLVKEKEL
ncbi:MAG: ROK family protein [Candidatus Omnitrophica bacterium]|nr:ROK family protein [Candidatus Omnitrophota bacterium]